jgi:hypothetical protein
MLHDQSTYSLESIPVKHHQSRVQRGVPESAPHHVMERQQPLYTSSCILRVIFSAFCVLDVGRRLRGAQ